MKNIFLIIFLIISCQLAISQVDSVSIFSKEKHKNAVLDMFATGYQIGGITYFGFEYEFRFSKYIGLNSGIGILGFSGGLKFHSCPCRSGPFLNISFKDGGFGNNRNNKH